MKETYKGHVIDDGGDHTGNTIKIDGVSHTREWHNTAVDDAFVFAKAWIDEQTVASPTIHLNGTNKSDLLKAYFEARHAIYEAIKALGETAPNGRDYYVQGNTAIYRAINEHTERQERLQAVYNELGEIIKAIDAQ